MPAATIQHLNGDTSWLLTLPTPHGPLTILLDPWFLGPQIDFHPAFSKQTRVVNSQFSTVSELVEWLERPQDGWGSRTLDGVFIGFEFSDHLHRDTISSVPSGIPFFAVPRAAAILRSWGHRNIFEISTRYPKSLQDLCPHPDLLHEKGKDVTVEYVGSTSPWWKDLAGARLHGGLCIVFKDPEYPATQSIVYSPHGLPASDLLRWKEKNTGVEGLAIIAGWDEVWNPWWLAGPLNLGLPNNVHLAKSLQTKYWIRTHDEEKTMQGLVGKVLKRRNWARETVQEEVGDSPCRAVELGVGECLVLNVGTGSTVDGSHSSE